MSLRLAPLAALSRPGLLLFALGVSSCCGGSGGARPEPAPSSSAEAQAPPAPSSSSGAMARASALASGSAPAPTPPSEPPPEEPVRWLAGPARALLTRAHDVVVLDPLKRVHQVIAPGDGAVLFAGESPSGELLGVLTEGGHLHLYRTGDGSKLRAIDCPQRGAYGVGARPVAFRADGKQVAAVCADTEVFEVESGQRLGGLDDRRLGLPLMLAFHAERPALIVSDAEGFRAHDASKFTPLGPASKPPGTAVITLSPDGRFVAVAPVAQPDSPAAPARLHRMLSPADLGVLVPDEPPGPSLEARFSPDGAALFVKKPGAWTRVIAPGSMRSRVRASAPLTSGYAPSVSADGGRAFVFSEPGSWVVDVKTGATVSRLDTRAYLPNEISPDGEFLLEPGWPGVVVRSATDGKVRLRFGEKPSVAPAPEALAPFEPPADDEVHVYWLDEQRLVSWSVGAAWLVEVEKKTSTRIGATLGPLTSWVETADGGSLLVGRDGVEIRRKDGSLGGVVTAKISGNGQGVTLSHDGKLLAQVGAQVRVWEVASGRQIHLWASPLSNPSDAAFTPDSSVLVLASVSSFVLLDLQTGKQLGESHETGTGGTFPTIVSPDGRWVGAGSENGHSAQVWSAYPFRFAAELAHAKDCQNHTAVYFQEGGRRASAWSNGEVLSYEAGVWKNPSVTRAISQEVGWLPSDRSGRLVVQHNPEKREGAILEVGSGRPLVKLEGEVVGSLSISGDGKLVVEVTSEQVIVRSGRDGKLRGRIATGEARK